jgi:uncharacterized membrane protein
MPLALVGVFAILVLTLAVPFAFRAFWPGGVARPSLFLLVTLTLALIVAAFAISWFSQILVGIGIAHPSTSTLDNSALFEARLRNRFFAASVCAVVAQYWLCRATQFFLGR